MPAVIPFITKENAKQLAKLGNDARANNLRELRDALDILTEKGQDAYRGKRAARVRKQLDRIDEMMMMEEDPQKLDRLASAQARLAEQERLLVGRPLPGSLKPTSKTPRKVDAEPIPEPIHAQPTPQAVVSPVAKVETTSGNQSGPLFAGDPLRA